MLISGPRSPRSPRREWRTRKVIINRMKRRSTIGKITDQETQASTVRPDLQETTAEMVPQETQEDQ